MTINGLELGLMTEQERRRFLLHGEIPQWVLDERLRAKNIDKTTASNPEQNKSLPNVIETSFAKKSAIWLIKNIISVIILGVIGSLIAAYIWERLL